MNSRKALEELRRMNPQTTIQNTMFIDRYLDLCKEVVENRLDQLEKAIKILGSRLCLHNKNYITYDNLANSPLTQDEFDLLKGVFTDEE